jgi:hypothetical protein
MHAGQLAHHGTLEELQRRSGHTNLVDIFLQILQDDNRAGQRGDVTSSDDIDGAAEAEVV